MTSLRGFIVLVVDDDDDVRDVLAEMLERAGAVVVVVAAASGREALAFVDATPYPDAIVAELLTHDGDGLWLLGQVRQRQLTMPVLALAGHLDARSRPGLLQQGFADVVLKPVGPADLVRAVALSLGQSPATGPGSRQAGSALEPGADRVTPARARAPRRRR
jgi:CheY-like chemotaxis protein